MADASASRRTFSILSVLLQCDSATNVLSMNPSLVPLLLNQLSERNRSYCSQITSVFLTLLIGAYAEMPRAQWIAACLDPIVEMVYASPDGRVNVFDYILPAILNIKPKLLPPALREESAAASHSATSLFGLDLFFLQAARSHPEDPVTSALLELSVMNVEKEIGVVGKKNEPYLLETSENPRNISRAMEYAQCGVDEIRMGMMKLVTESLYVGLNRCCDRIVDAADFGAGVENHCDDCARVVPHGQPAVSPRSQRELHASHGARDSLFAGSFQAGQRGAQRVASLAGKASGDFGFAGASAIDALSRSVLSPSPPRDRQHLYAVDVADRRYSSGRADPHFADRHRFAAGSLHVLRSLGTQSIGCLTFF